jgi:transcriptional regulator with XRE-family HTH domain
MEELGFGLWLSRQRKLLGLTQKQLAQRVNCATITVRKLEAEQRRPSLQVVERLASALEIPPDEKDHFTHFALGYGHLESPASPMSYPWQESTFDLPPQMLSSLITHIGQGHQLSQVNDFFLDEHVHHINSPDPAQFDSAESGMRFTHDASSRNQNSMIVFMLVPIEIPNNLASNIMQNTHLADLTGDQHPDAKSSPTRAGRTWAKAH